MQSHTSRLSNSPLAWWASVCHLCSQVVSYYKHSKWSLRRFIQVHMMYLSCHCMRFVQTDAESALRLADYTTVCLSVSVWKKLSSSRRNNLNPKIKVADNNENRYWHILSLLLEHQLVHLLTSLSCNSQQPCNDAQYRFYLTDIC